MRTTRNLFRNVSQFITAFMFDVTIFSECPTWTWLIFFLQQYYTILLIAVMYVRVEFQIFPHRRLMRMTQSYPSWSLSGFSSRERAPYIDLGDLGTCCRRSNSSRRTKTGRMYRIFTYCFKRISFLLLYFVRSNVFFDRKRCRGKYSSCRRIFTCRDLSAEFTFYLRERSI